MKALKFLMVTVIAVSVLSSCSQQPATGYTLTANLKGLPDGVQVQLVPVSTYEQKPVADTTVVNGQFTFTGMMEEPRAVRLIVQGGYGSRLLMLENGKIRLEGEVKTRAGEEATNYDFSDVKVSGSPLTDKYLELMSVRESLDSIYMDNNERHKVILSLYAEAYQTGNKVRLDSIVSTDEYKALEEANRRFFAKVEQTYHEVVLDNRDSFWGPLMMVSLFSYLTAEQKPWYDELSEEAKASYYGRMVKEEVDPSAKEGGMVPAFSVKDEEGNTITLNKLCEGKRYILIDFWASWCKPCRKEIPNLKELYSRYADKGFQIISISIDKKKAEWEKALKEEKLSWPNFLDDGELASLYKVRFVPTMYLITSEGKIVAENVRGQELADKVAELFK